MNKKVETEASWEMTVTTDDLKCAASHRGHAFPRTFVASFTSADIEVVMNVRVEEARGPVPTSVTIRSDSGVSGRDVQQPVIKMAHRAAREIALEVEKVSGDQAELAVYRVKPVSLRSQVKVGELPTRRAADLDEVANWYREAIEKDEPVGEYVKGKLGLSIDRAYQLIREARSKGYLPRTKKGRKQA
jgi:hypothetical protein